MSIATIPIKRRTHGRLYDALWRRQLTQYPRTPARMGYLGMVVLTTIVLYYLYYVEGAVTPLMLPYYHMSFLYFLYLLVVSNAIGAFTAFIGGLSDKIGRANLTIYGTLTVGLVQLVGVPHIHSEFGFAVAYCVIGFVEGIILVSTPALMRDFSPQMGRGTAMGFWALGPTVGSLAASIVATRTLAHLHPWQDQFIISGLVCMGVVVIAFFSLRELSPQLRDQLMVSENERALVEARAKGIDVEKATRHPIRSMMRLDLIASSLGISVFLLIYFASVSVLTLYWVVIFNRTTADANGINTWYWACMSTMLVVFGILSDRVRVRKPFMVVGAVGTIVMTFILLGQIDHPTTGYYSNILVVVLLGLFIGATYTPWMAGYTEAVEAHNPALSASGSGGVGMGLADRGGAVVHRAPQGHHHLHHAGGQPGGRHQPADVPGSSALCSRGRESSPVGRARRASSRRSRRCSPTVPGRPWRRCSRPTGPPTTSWRAWQRCPLRSSSRSKAC